VTYEVIGGDLRGSFTSQAEGGGFADATLYDSDDHLEMILGEDELVGLYYWLHKKLSEDGLIPPKPKQP